MIKVLKPLVLPTGKRLTKGDTLRDGDLDPETIAHIASIHVLRTTGTDKPAKAEAAEEAALIALTPDEKLAAEGLLLATAKSKVSPREVKP